jgi:hypothetical protein
MASNTMKNKEYGQKMNKGDRVAEKVAETLAGFDAMERLDAGPDFFSKLQARINAGSGEPAPADWPRFFSPILRPAFLALLIAINIVSVVFVARTGQARDKAEKATVGTVARDYSLDQNLHELYFAAEDVEP